MTIVNLISLIVMGVVFVLWAVTMFTALWQITRRSLDDLKQTGGGYFTWAGHSLRGFRGFLTSDNDKRARRRILILTLLLFVPTIPAL